MKGRTANQDGTRSGRLPQEVASRITFGPLINEHSKSAQDFGAGQVWRMRVVYVQFRSTNSGESECRTAYPSVPVATFPFPWLSVSSTLRRSSEGRKGFSRTFVPYLISSRNSGNSSAKPVINKNFISG